MNTHISSQFDAELQSIRAQLTHMGGLVEDQLAASLKALSTKDISDVERIIKGDREVDALEVAIDDACVHVIAKRQPTAIDLRLVMAIVKVVKDLERIGDEAKKIAKTVRKIHERGVASPMLNEVDLAHLGDMVLPAVHAVLDAFVRSDAQAAADLVRQDRAIDMQFRAAVRQLVTFMMEDARTITNSLDLIFVAKSIERIGDHVKNIAEYVIYIAEGTDVRHGGIKLDIEDETEI
jgi:phosphate transport system protein